MVEESVASLQPSRHTVLSHWLFVCFNFSSFVLLLQGSERYFNLGGSSGGGGGGTTGSVSVSLGGGGGGGGFDHHHASSRSSSIGGLHHHLNPHHSHHHHHHRLTDCDDIDQPVRCEVCDKPFHDVDQ